MADVGWYNYCLSIPKISVMKKILMIGAFASVFAACTQNAITGRKQLALLSESELQNMALQEILFAYRFIVFQCLWH